MTEHHLECLSLNEAVQARLSLLLSKCQNVGNHMSRLMSDTVQNVKLVQRYYTGFIFVHLKRESYIVALLLSPVVSRQLIAISTRTEI